MSWNWTLLLETVVALAAGYFVAALIFRTVEKIAEAFTLPIIGIPAVIAKGLGLPVRDPERPLSSDSRLKWVLWGWSSFIILAMFLLGSVTILATPFLKHAYLWILGILGLKTTQLLIGVSVIVLGFAAFVLKSKHQRTYGMVEVVFAGVAGIITARQIKPGADWSGQIATLIGAVYIVSRGLGNIKDGFKARNEQN